MANPKSTYTQSPDHEWSLILRHADGGVCLRDSGDSRDELLAKANAEWERAVLRLGKEKAAGMTLAIYRRVEMIRGKR